MPQTHSKNRGPLRTFAALLALASVVAIGDSSSEVWLARMGRLSLDVRGQRLDEAESDALTKRLDRETPIKVYESVLDAWMTRAFFRRLAMQSFATDRARSRFLGTLTRMHDDTGEVVYALPEDAAVGPCRTAERRSVRPWWAVGRAVKICSASYGPERSFDEVGYCAGQAEPTVPTPRRPRCGCGPFLIGCLPPDDEGALADRVDADASAEVIETATDILATGRPFDEILTTSTTWQTGLVEMLYARRELIGDLARVPYTPEIEQRWAAKLAKIEINAPGHWVKREGVYTGAGLYLTTPASEATFPTFRVQMFFTEWSFLCVMFSGVNVDRDSLLAAVDKSHGNLRSLKVHDSPMRSQVGCSGCHAPMDFGAAFLVGLTTPLYGASPTNERATGKLYVKGANDYRGEGVGFSGLGRLITAQPEFETCAVDRAFGLTGTTGGQALKQELLSEFQTNHHSLGPIVRRVLLSDAYIAPKRK